MSDHYTVLARRFRPQTFDDVVGQEHVGRAIQNAIKAGRVAHAYLFTGARGVGKTSTARIFAKALNCPNVADGVPCNDCEICDGIGNGSDVDVLEIDGASNRGIDDIRQLRANVNIRSMRSPFKVYIIDEVHMLTKEAFNALLKTLEEPPPNVKFIFCTTEPQKVPDTILSRCQRFDFGTIESSRIEDRLKEIATAEGVGVDDEAVAMVARRAGGSMRDSQSLFDQLLAFGGEQITADDVHRLFGTAPDERVVALMDAIIAGDRAAAMTVVDESLNAGVRLDSLTDQLVAYVRDLMVLAVGATSLPLSAVSDRLRDQLSTQAEQFGLRTATASLQILSDAKLKMSRTVHARPLLELAVVRLSLLEDLDGLAALVQAARSGELASLPTAPAGGVKKKLSTEPVAPAPPPPVITPSDTHAAAPEQPPPPSNGHAVAPPASSPIDAPAVAPPATLSLTPDTFAEFWNQLIQRVPDKLAARLSEVKSKQLATDGRVHVTAATPFALNQLQSAPTRKRLDTLTAALTGSPVAFIFDVDETTQPAVIQERQTEPQLRKKSAVDDDPFVNSALELFGGQIVQVKALPAAVISADARSDDAEVDVDGSFEDSLSEDDDNV